MLSTAERLSLRQARVRLKARDLATVEKLLSALIDSPRRSKRPPDDYPRLPGLDSVFFCSRLKGHMAIEDCLVRRSRIWPSGGGKGCPRFDECRGCPVGEENVARAPGFVPPPSTMAPEVLSNSQRMAKRARALVGLEDDEVVRVDPMQEVARLTPDDGSDWRT
jgi:hypothetical protein